MKTKKEYIDILKLHVPELKNQFGIRSFRLFGSVARDEQQDDSDVDVCVEMDPDLYQLVGLKQFLEKLLGCSVDVIRIHRNMNKLLMKQIEKDGFMSSDIQEMVLGIFRQIENSILLLQEWNTEINQVDDYLLSPEGMKNLAASCMLIEAIGEGVKKIDKRRCAIAYASRNTLE